MRKRTSRAARHPMGLCRLVRFHQASRVFDTQRWNQQRRFSNRPRAQRLSVAPGSTRRVSRATAVIFSAATAPRWRNNLHAPANLPGWPSAAAANVSLPESTCLVKAFGRGRSDRDVLCRITCIVGSWPGQTGPHSPPDPKVPLTSRLGTARRTLGTQQVRSLF